MNPFEAHVKKARGLASGWYYLIVNTGNHRILSTSQRYTRRSSARRAAKAAPGIALVRTYDRAGRWPRLVESLLPDGTWTRSLL